MGFVVRTTCDCPRIIVYKASKNDKIVSGVYSACDNPYEAVKEVLGHEDFIFEMRISSDVYSYRLP